MHKVKNLPNLVNVFLGYDVERNVSTPISSNALKYGATMRIHVVIVRGEVISNQQCNVGISIMALP